MKHVTLGPRLLTALILLGVSAQQALSASAQFQTHPVKAIPRAGRIVVEYAGMPLTVRLAHLAPPGTPEARARLVAEVEKLVEGKKIRVAYCPEAGLDPEGLPQVYAFVTIKNVNQELVRMGLARYDPRENRSRHYHQKMVSADAAARKAKVGIWAPREARAAAITPTPARASTGGRMVAAGGALPPGLYSELNSSMYHLPTCRWAKQMSPQRRIRYRSHEAAERGGKRPCWICLPRRAQSAMVAGIGPRSGRVRVVAARGPIVGYAGGFHAPNCERILDHAAECTGFRTAGEAKAAGLAPCDRCLRLSGGPIPLPQKGECIGRAPPHRRPCRRAPADDSGLCSHCQGKGE